MRKNCAKFAMCICILLPTFLSASNNDSLKEGLSAKYTLTKVGWDKIRITSPGTILVVRKDGIATDIASDSMNVATLIVNGQPEAAKGFMAAMLSKNTTRTLKVGERMYLSKIDVKDDAIGLHLISVETSDINRQGSTKETRFSSYVYFKFPKEVLASASADDIKKQIDAILIPEEQLTNAAPKTIELGQSPAQVESALGKPEKVVNLGPKKIYIYKDTKVIFQDDKVADVQ
jgi:hypothetical protein